MDQRFVDSWAEMQAEEVENMLEKNMSEKQRMELLRKQQRQADMERIREQEGAMKRKAEEMLQARAALAASNGLPFSIQIGGREMAPAVVWSGLALTLAWVFRAAILPRLSPDAHKQGKWVRDRSLGGKLVWVEADDLPQSASVDGPAADSSRYVSDEDFDKLASFASAARTAQEVGASNGTTTYQPPPWWDPAPYMYASTSVAQARSREADVVLSKLQQSKVRGSDYNVADIVKLRSLCQEGNVVVKPSTAGGRDSIYRAGVEAAAAAALAANYSTIGDVEPTRFVSALAGDLGMAEERAVDAVCAVVAAQARNRLLEGVTALKKSNDLDACTAMELLRKLVVRFPVLSDRHDKYAALVSSSLHDRSKEAEREKLLSLLAFLEPESKYCWAVAGQLLGFEPETVVARLAAETGSAGSGDVASSA